MYSIGETVMYGETGACVVENIEPIRTTDGVEKLFYVLKPVYQRGLIRVPVDNIKVPIRAVLTRAEAVALINSIPTIEYDICREKNLNALRQYYQKQMSSYEAGELMRLKLSICAKREEAELERKKFGLTDEKYLHRTEELLFGELALALNVEKGAVAGYIAEAMTQKLPAETV